MKIPLGDVLRAILPWKWLNALKGISITKGDTTILLNQNPGGESKPFDTPHRLEPPR